MSKVMDCTLLLLGVAIVGGIYGIANKQPGVNSEAVHCPHCGTHLWFGTHDVRQCWIDRCKRD
jgi:hypothetical protein